jgi:di/tricarboxylate transporter
MVYGPGGYRFRDYAKVGLPLDMLLAIVGIALIPWMYGWERP